MTRLSCIWYAEVRLVPLWLGGHVRAMRERLPGKPLVLEEFGKVGSAVPIPDKFYYNVRSWSRPLKGVSLRLSWLGTTDCTAHV